MIERKYALTRIEKGDYLWASNDAKTIWRLSTYTEGPSRGLVDWPRDRTVWGLWRWDGPRREGLELNGEDVDDWNYWEMWEGMFETRTAAIEAAMTAA